MRFSQSQLYIMTYYDFRFENCFVTVHGACKWYSKTLPLPEKECRKIAGASQMVETKPMRGLFERISFQL